eukprot:7294219-Prymnesium_polylepis.1
MGHYGVGGALVSLRGARGSSILLSYVLYARAQFTTPSHARSTPGHEGFPEAQDGGPSQGRLQPPSGPPSSVMAPTSATGHGDGLW